MSPTRTQYSAKDILVAAPSSVENSGRTGNEAAQLLLRTVRERGAMSIAELAHLLRVTYGISKEEAWEGAVEFASGAQLAGVISMKTSLTTNVVHGVGTPLVDVLLYPVRLYRPQRPVRRMYLSPTGASTIQASVRTQTLLACALTPPVALALYLVLGPPTFMGFLAGFGLTLFAAIVVGGTIHEYAHFAAAKAAGAPVTAVFRDGVTVGLRRASVERPAVELLISLAGPASALTFLVGLIVLVASFGSNLTGAVVAQSALLGALFASSLQLACLVPPSADGRAIFSSLNGNRE